MNDVAQTVVHEVLEEVVAALGLNGSVEVDSDGEVVTIKRDEKLTALANELGGNVPVRKKAPSNKDVLVWLYWDEWKPA